MHLLQRSTALSPLQKQQVNSTTGKSLSPESTIPVSVSLPLQSVDCGPTRRIQTAHRFVRILAFSARKQVSESPMNEAPRWSPLAMQSSRKGRNTRQLLLSDSDDGDDVCSDSQQPPLRVQSHRGSPKSKCLDGIGQAPRSPRLVDSRALPDQDSMASPPTVNPMQRPLHEPFASLQRSGLGRSQTDYNSLTHVLQTPCYRTDAKAISMGQSPDTGSDAPLTVVRRNARKTHSHGDDARDTKTGSSSGAEFFTPEGTPASHDQKAGSMSSHKSNLSVQAMHAALPGHQSPEDSSGSSANALAFTRSVRKPQGRRVLDDSGDSTSSGGADLTGGLQQAAALGGVPRRTRSVGPISVPSAAVLVAPELKRGVIVISSDDSVDDEEDVLRFKVPRRRGSSAVSGATANTQSRMPAKDRVVAEDAAIPGLTQPAVRGALELAALMNRQCTVSDAAPAPAPAPAPWEWQRQRRRSVSPSRDEEAAAGAVRKPVEQPTIIDLASSASDSGFSSEELQEESRGVVNGRHGPASPRRPSTALAPVDSEDDAEVQKERGEQLDRKQTGILSFLGGRPSKKPMVAGPKPGLVAPPRIVLPDAKSLQLVPSRKKAAANPHLAFARKRVEMSRQLYDDWNDLVFGGRLPADLPVVWNLRLLSTAGQVLDDGSRNSEKKSQSERIPTRLELSAKVIDCPERLRSTLAHEMCHVAAWALDREFHPHHGPAFWRWAGAVSKALPDIEVTRLHSFSTFAPYRWQCQNTSCNKTYSRHRATIDPKRHACGVCHGKLVFLGKYDRAGVKRPEAGVEEAGAAAAAATTAAVQQQEAAAAAGGPHAYRQFIKQNFASVKSSQPPGTPHGSIMKVLSAQWSTVKKVKQQEGKQATVVPGQEGEQGKQGRGGGSSSRSPSPRLVRRLELDAAGADAGTRAPAPAVAAADTPYTGAYALESSGSEGEGATHRVGGRRRGAASAAAVDGLGERLGGLSMS